jgi:hypothetical protein
MAAPTQPTDKEKYQRAKQTTTQMTDTRGSGSDLNSDTDRLENSENLRDKMDEDSFPASDSPSTSPVIGVGSSSRRKPGALPADFKDNPVEQFKYGRRVEDATHHFDTSTHRHAIGNPDVGEVDLGTIEADQPAERDDAADDLDDLDVGIDR